MNQEQAQPGSSALSALAGATDWLNSEPLTAAQLHGQVVVLDIWTYSCINWLRTLPYVRAWNDTYGSRGLVTVGVHSPEFDFERNIANVRRAATNLHVDYPIAVDSEHRIWNALHNQYWPALYLIDAHGQIRHHHFGEGGHEQSELTIQTLLHEAGADSVRDAISVVHPHGVEAAADWHNLETPESYLGYQRSQTFVSPGGAVPDRKRSYAVPTGMRLNSWALSGEWTIGKQSALLNEANGSITYRFHARDAHLVMGPAAPPVRFRVRIDGRNPGGDHGLDVDDEGLGAVTEPRLYQLLRQSGPITERTLEITFLDPGVHAYVFTFG